MISHENLKSEMKYLRDRLDYGLLPIINMLKKRLIDLERMVAKLKQERRPDNAIK